MGKLAPALVELGTWFERQKRILPWRDDPSLYRVWVSEIMLQQTQVITVVPYFERFLTAFSSVEDLAKAPEEAVLARWAGLGYYSRARNLKRAAERIVAAGDFPRTLEGWLELPGVGRYTAGAILSIALNQARPILDGNVERVLSRVRRIGRGRGDAAFKARLWRLSALFVEKGADENVPPRTLNQALMELGATICTPKRPACMLCPLNSICRAREVGDPERFPPRKAPKAWMQVEERLDCVIAVEAAVYPALRGKAPARVWVRQRGPGEWRAGLWDLPESDLGLGEGLSQREDATCLGTVESRHVVTRHKISRTTLVWKIAAAADAPPLLVSAVVDELAVRETISRGKIQARRATRLRAAESSHADLSPRGAESVAASIAAPGRWVNLRDPEVPVGSALTRTISLVCERFPEVSPGH